MWIRWTYVANGKTSLKYTMSIVDVWFEDLCFSYWWGNFYLIRAVDVADIKKKLFLNNILFSLRRLYWLDSSILVPRKRKNKHLVSSSFFFFLHTWSNVDFFSFSPSLTCLFADCILILSNCLLSKVFITDQY